MTSYLYRSTRLLVVPCLLFVALASAQDAEFSGKVVGVIDGDTIDVMHLGKAERVRLYGVDSPEKNQAFGTKAKQFTSDQVFGKEVRVVVRDTDRYGRTVGDVFLPGGKRLNEELVRAGMAWWYKDYAPRDRAANVPSVPEGVHEPKDLLVSDKTAYYSETVKMPSGRSPMQTATTIATETKRAAITIPTATFPFFSSSTSSSFGVNRSKIFNVIPRLTAMDKAPTIAQPKVTRYSPNRNFAYSIFVASFARRQFYLS